MIFLRYSKLFLIPSEMKNERKQTHFVAIKMDNTIDITKIIPHVNCILLHRYPGSSGNIFFKRKILVEDCTVNELANLTYLML